MTIHQSHKHTHPNINSSTELLSNAEFLHQFNNQTLNPIHFNHVGHLRLAWIYLSHHDLETSVKGVCKGIEAYAESLGANTKFHITITDSLVRIMAKRLSLMTQKDWQSFLDQSSDMVEDAVSVLLQYFSKDLLFSESARTSLAKPDIQPI
ncbi:MAG: hypothetical protein AAF490_21535 [Chloroflexota bacterium]